MDKAPEETEVIKAAQRYSNSLNYPKVSERRANWKRAKEILVPELEKVAEEVRSVGVRAYVLAAEMFENFGTVQFSLGKEPTGILYKDETEWAVGVQHGGALVFSQSENGMIRVLAYPASTELPKSKGAAREIPWIGPSYEDPLSITSDIIQHLVIVFLDLASSSSIWSDGGVPSPKVLEVFWRPPELQDTHELVTSVKSDTLRADALLTWGLPVLLDQVGEMFEHFENQEVQRMLKLATPRAVKAVARFVALKSGGMVTEDEILSKMSGRQEDSDS